MFGAYDPNIRRSVPVAASTKPRAELSLLGYQHQSARKQRSAAMKLRSNACTLKTKALSSMRSAVVAFNSPVDDGRATSVLLHLQHSFEMLLKASLQQSRVAVFDKRTGRSIGYEKAVALAQNSAKLKLSSAEAGTLRAIDAMRDDEQHWFTDVSEGQLYLHTRAGVTLFDDLLERAFGERLADHLPLRVLPISLEPPQDFVQLIDRDFSQVKELLKPGRRAGAAARAKIRGLLALGAHVEPDTRVSNADVNRVEAGIKAGRSRRQVFPKLEGVGADVVGDGVSVTVRFSKHDGMPVRVVRNDEFAGEAAAVREVDLQKRYHWSSPALAEKLALTGPRLTALRRHLGIDEDPACQHIFTFGAQKHPRYSDNAFTKLRDAESSLDMDAIWQAHRPRQTGQSAPPCTEEGCRLAAAKAAAS